MTTCVWLQGLTALGFAGVGLCGCNGKAVSSPYLHLSELSAEPPTRSAPPSQQQPKAYAAPGTSSADAQDALGAGARPTAVASARDASIKPLATKPPAACKRTVVAPVLPSTPKATSSTSSTPEPSAVPAPSAEDFPQAPNAKLRIASVGGVAVTGGDISNAARIIADLRDGLRECYRNDQSGGGGSISLRLTIGATGAVTAVAAPPSGDVSAGLVQCTTTQARAAKFEPPTGGAASVSFPVSFILLEDILRSR